MSNKLFAKGKILCKPIFEKHFCCRKAFHEAEIAYLKHDKADKNMDLSRSEVERAKNNVHQKNQICEQAKQGYGHALEMANRTKNEHYQIKMPNLLEDMRRLDIDRIESTKSAMMASIQAETSVANIVKRLVLAEGERI